MSNDNSFGDFLKEFIETNNISTHKLHELSGVSQPYISQIINGKKPSVKIIEKISKALNLDYLLLMDKAGYISPLLKAFENEGNKIEYDICFKMPAFEFIDFGGGITGEKYISLEDATESFFNIKNLLNLNPSLVNLDGRKLSNNDIKKILSKIYEIEDEFEYQK